MAASESRAFGVEPGHPPYRLRQARYQALGEDVARIAMQIHQRRGGSVRLLDVGVGKGVSRMYTEVHPGAEHIEYHAVDRYWHGPQRVYQYDQWQHYTADLERGLPDLSSDQFDIVVCEQVLEHLHQAPHALGELSRVTRPGGWLVVGVPIFPHGVHALRKYVVPWLDQRLGHKPRPHVQAFSKRTFLDLIGRQCEVEIRKTRGFRIASGGLLRPLEYCRWWWRLNRQVGALVPGLCVEIQVLAQKRAAAGPSSAAPPVDADRRRAA